MHPKRVSLSKIILIVMIGKQVWKRSENYLNSDPSEWISAGWDVKELKLILCIYQPDEQLQQHANSVMIINATRGSC